MVGFFLFSGKGEFGPVREEERFPWCGCCGSGRILVSKRIRFLLLASSFGAEKALWIYRLSHTCVAGGTKRGRVEE